MGKVYLAVRRPTASRSRSRCCRRERRSRKRTRSGGFAARWTSRSAVRTRTWPGRSSVGSEGDVHFMVMEYIPGESLYDLVKSERGGPLRVPDAARLFLKVLDGLEAAHAAGLVHRDIKPSNIMITPDGDAKLLDLGLARALDDENGLDPGQHACSARSTTPAPSSSATPPRPTRRSDLYSLGCTLYFALAGRPPFEGGDMINKIFKQRMEDPEPLENRGARRPGGVRRDRPQADGQEARGALPDLRRAPRRPGALDRPGAGPRDPRRRGRGRPQFPPPRPSSTKTTSASWTARIQSATIASPSATSELPSPRWPPATINPYPPCQPFSDQQIPGTRDPQPAPAPQSTETAWLFQFALIVVAVGLVAIVIISILFRS